MKLLSPVSLIFVFVVLGVSPCAGQRDIGTDRIIIAISEDLDSINKGVCLKDYETYWTCKMRYSASTDTVFKEMVMDGLDTDNILIFREYRFSTYLFNPVHELYKIIWYDSAVHVDPKYPPRVSLTQFIFFSEKKRLGVFTSRVHFLRTSYQLASGTRDVQRQDQSDTGEYPYNSPVTNEQKLRYRVPVKL